MLQNERQGGILMRMPAEKDFLFTIKSKLALALNQPHIQYVTKACSPRVKWPGREAGH